MWTLTEGLQLVWQSSGKDADAVQGSDTSIIFIFSNRSLISRPFQSQWRGIHQLSYYHVPCLSQGLFPDFITGHFLPSMTRRYLPQWLPVICHQWLPVTHSCNYAWLTGGQPVTLSLLASPPRPVVPNLGGIPPQGGIWPSRGGGEWATFKNNTTPVWVKNTFNL